MKPVVLIFNLCFFINNAHCIFLKHHQAQEPLFKSRINQEIKSQEDQFEEWGKLSGVGRKDEPDLFVEDEYKWKSKVMQKQDSNYIYYIVETPSMLPVYTLDNFKIDVNRESIVIKGKVGEAKKIFDLHKDLSEKNDYHSIIYLEYALRAGAMPVFKREIIPNNKFRFTIQLSKTSFDIPMMGMVKPDYRETIRKPPI